MDLGSVYLDKRVVNIGSDANNQEVGYKGFEWKIQIFTIREPLPLFLISTRSRWAILPGGKKA